MRDALAVDDCLGDRRRVTATRERRDSCGDVSEQGVRDRLVVTTAYEAFDRVRRQAVSVGDIGVVDEDRRGNDALELEKVSPDSVARGRSLGGNLLLT